MENRDNAASVADLIAIPISALGDDLNCPICWTEIKTAVITHCGHRFCEECIQKSISAWKKCPVCNKGLAKSELIHDKGFDNLIRVIEEQKKEAATTYFNQIAAKAEGELRQDGCLNIVNASIQPVLQKHLKKSLLEFELYSQQLQRELSEQTLLSLQKSGNGDVAFSPPHEILQNCLSSVVDAYDRFLTENLPPLSLLPVTVEVRIHGKDIKLPPFQFEPSTSLEELYKAVGDRLSVRADPVVQFCRNEISFILARPSAGVVCLTPELLTKLILDQSSDNYSVTTAPLVIMAEKSLPRLMYNVSPGSEVIIYGNLKFASEMPKQCFVKVFRKDAGIKMDYFACKDCKLKWICKPCKESCHVGHDLQTHVKGHAPSWPCCYCQKNRCALSEGQSS